MIRGAVWLINLDPTVGAEIKKVRPAIIINHNDIGILPLKIIVPLTDWKERYASSPWMVKIVPNSENGLNKNSAADAFQVRSVSEQRFVKKVGEISDFELARISNALKLVLDLT